MAEKEFKQVAIEIINKYPSSPLLTRWQEATAFGEGSSAQSYWIRDSADVVNIVWLNSDGIRDITWIQSLNESMFNFVRLRNIITFEIREKSNIALQSLGVVGDYVVNVIQSGLHGNLWWVAENEESAQRLRVFLASTLANYVHLL